MEWASHTACRPVEATHQQSHDIKLVSNKTRWAKIGHEQQRVLAAHVPKATTGRLPITGLIEKENNA
jgi:hypothetical protein